MTWKEKWCRVCLSLVKISHYGLVTEVLSYFEISDIDKSLNDKLNERKSDKKNKGSKTFVLNS